MSSLVIHMIIPVLLALGVGLFKPRDAWTWSWAAWAVDVDYVGWILHNNYGWPNVHRALFHNVWLLFIAVWLGVRAWKRFRNHSPDPTLAAFAKATPGWLLVPFYYTTHLFLDLFAGGVAFLWPLTTHTYDWAFAMEVDTTKPVPVPEVYSDPGVAPVIPDVSPIYTWMTGEEFALIMLYLLSLLLFHLYRTGNTYTLAMAALDRKRKAGRKAKATK